jgi:hypothetical protein
LQAAFNSLLADGNIECGYYNTEQTVECPDETTRTTPAGEFFSTVSQEDADAQALAPLAEECVTLCTEEFDNFTWNTTATPNDGAASANAAGGVAQLTASGGGNASAVTNNFIILGAPLACTLTVSGSSVGVCTTNLRRAGSLIYTHTGEGAFSDTVPLTLQTWGQFSFQVLSSQGISEVPPTSIVATLFFGT